jgi:hypothetical protein
MSKKPQSIETSQELIPYEEFKDRYRTSEKVFTRTRKLYFSL